MTPDQVRERIARATDRNGLAAAWEALAAWYAANPSDRATYEAMYNAYTQRYYAVVGAEGGGPGVGAGAGAGAGAGVQLSPFQTEEQYGPYTAYLQALGLGETMARQPFQRYQEAQFAPLQSMYNLASRLWGGGADIPEQAPFGEWAKRYAPSLGPTAAGQYGAPVSMSQQAQTIMRQLYGAEPGERELAGLTFEPAYTEEGGFAGIPATGLLQGVLGAALRPRFGRTAAQWLTQNIPAQQQRWMGQMAGGTLPQETSFLDYLRRVYPQTAF